MASWILASSFILLQAGLVFAATVRISPSKPLNISSDERTQAQSFTPAAQSPFATSTNYTGPTNGSLPVEPVTKGKVFDRFIQVCNGVAKKKWFGAECTLC